jgi:hypothetical protein
MKGYFRLNGGEWTQSVPAGAKAEGIIALAGAIPDMGAISSVNVLGNEIGIEQAQVLAAILKEHRTLKSLCGHKGDETELNMSSKEIGVEGAIMLAPEIVDNGALTKLDISNNNIEQGEALQRIADLCHTKGVELDNHKSESESDYDY